jgi:hypothetical protein
MGIPPVIVTFALHTMPALWQFDRLEAYPTRLTPRGWWGTLDLLWDDKRLSTDSF